ncbi:MAG: radical SAM protein, partial [Candidatus Odinarchaeota archaeon]
MSKKSLKTSSAVSEKGDVLDLTESICPECWINGVYKILPAKVVSKDGKVYITRSCEVHGEIEEIYWSSVDLYLKSRKYAQDGCGIGNPYNVEENPVCPLSCGFCKIHLSGPALANLVVTNRCDLNCWYCFFFAEKAGYVFEPSVEEIRRMVRNFRSVTPVPGLAVQITGGEPSIRDDIVEVINAIREEGVRHIQFNTDGLRLAMDKEFAKQIRSAGVNTVYLSFDGVSPATNPKNHWEVPFAVQNCREANKMGIVFVPTVINSVNDHDLGNIIDVAFRNLDVVRGVNFQPVSLTGRITRAERDKLRITSTDVIKRIEEQTGGQITRDDWYTVPSVGAVSRIISAITKRPQINFTNHFACGLATYVFLNDGKYVPIPQFIDVDGFFEYLAEKADELEKGKSKYVVGLKLLYNLKKFIDNDKKPKD